MQIKSIQQNRNFNNAPSFKMAIKATSRAKKILEKNLSVRETKKLEKLIEAEAKNPINVELDTELCEKVVSYDSEYRPTFARYDKFIAQVEARTFKPSFFSSYLTTIKRAIKYANQLQIKRVNLKNLENI